MPRVRPKEARIQEDGSFAIVEQVVGMDGDYIVQADISTITYRIYDRTAGAVVSGHDGASLTISAVIFDTLQENAVWTDVAPTDTVGYNFRHDVIGTAVATGDHVYEYIATITLTGSPAHVIKLGPWVLTTEGHSGS